MAHIITKKRKKKRKLYRDSLKYETQKKAFDLYMTLDDRFKRVYSLKKIAKILEIRQHKLVRWRDEGAWDDVLEKAIVKARERASNDAELRNLLTFYLYGDKIPTTAGVDYSEKLKDFEYKKVRRVRSVIRNLSDIIFETRKYNHMMFRALTARRESDYPKTVLKLDDRADIHRAWIDSLGKLIELFGVVPIRQLAAEILNDGAMSQNFAKSLQGEGNKSLPNGAPTADQILNQTNVVLGGEAQALILKVLLGDGGKINGPDHTYVGPKNTSALATEDATVVDSRRPNSEGED